MAGPPSGDPELPSPQDASAGAAGSAVRALRALRALVVDDEVPALEELSWLLRQDDRIAEVRTAGSGAEALRALEAGDIDVVFSDISMPGLDGMDLARVIARFTQRPQVVFVTAHDQHAVDAFAVDAVDYVMKPVRADRLAEAVRRVVASRGDRRVGARHRWWTTRTRRSPSSSPASRGSSPAARSATRRHRATTPGCTRRPGRTWSRIPLSTLEERWAAAGFVRIHRSTLVSLSHIKEVRMERGRCSVVLDEVELQVSRRHTRELRDRLLRPARQSE